MKKLIIAAAVVSLMAGSAFAEDANQKAGTAAGIVGARVVARLARRERTD
jgi:opacity protein-like surface antigen